MATITLRSGTLNLKGPQTAGVVDGAPQEGFLTLAGLAMTIALSTAMPAGAVGWTGAAPQAQSGAEVGLGSVLYTGLAPSVTVTQTSIAMSAGSLTWAGLTPSFRIGDVFLDLPAGSLVFKGPQRPQEIPQPLAGTILIGGLDPQVLVNTPGGSVAVPIGSLVLHSDAALRLTNTTPLPSAGSLVLSGQYVGVAFKALDAGSLVWQGLIPTSISTSQLVAAPGAASLVLHGTLSSLFKDQGPALPAGALVFHSGATVAATTWTIDLPAGALTYTGAAPVSIPTILLQLGVGRLLLNSQFVTPQIDRYPTPVAGSLTFIGAVPACDLSVADTVITVDVGAETFLGAEPVVTITAEASPDAGSLLWTGAAPDVNVGEAPQLVAGFLTFISDAPIAQVLGPFQPPAGIVAWHGTLSRVLNSGVLPSGESFQYYALYLY